MGTSIVVRTAGAFAVSILVLVCALVGADTPLPSPRTTAPATSRPILSDFEEAELAFRIADAGDPRIIPVALHWLAAEQDDQPIGYGTPRLRAAIHVVETLGVREAIPLLLSAYEQRSSTGDAKTRLAATVIILDRSNLAFCREVLAQDITPLRTKDNPAVAVASATLAATGDGKAIEILLHGYAEYLDALQAGNKVNFSFHRELNRMSDPKLRTALLALRKKYTADPAFNQIAIDAQLVRMNAMPQEKRLEIALNPEAKEADRFLALTSLGHTGGADALPALERAERWSPDFKPSTRPAATRAVRTGTTRATTAPRTASGTTQWAIELIRRRHQLEHSSENPPPINGLTAMPPLAEGETVMRIAALISGPDGRVTTRPVELREINGHAPEVYASAAEPLLRRIRPIPTEAMVRVKLDAKTRDVMDIAEMSTRPGEATPHGYVFVERRIVRDAGVDRVAVVLSKFSTQIVARVPNRNKAGGGVAPDKTLASAIETLHPGDVVEASIERLSPTAAALTMLAEIAPYRAATLAHFERWIEIPDGALAVELSIGRDKRPYLMPKPREAVPMAVAAETRDRFWQGCTVRIRPEDGPLQTPPRLRDFDVEGFQILRPDGGHIKVCAASATLQGDPRISPFMGIVAVFGKSGAISRAEMGVHNFLAGKGALPGEVTVEAREKLANAIKSPDKKVIAEHVTQMNRIFDRFTQSTDKSARRAAEQEIYLMLQRDSADVYDQQQRLRDQIMATLTPEQYKALIALGHFGEIPISTTRPVRLTPRPASRPATAP